MSRFFSRKYHALEPYTPGEQPKDMQYVKLNTNESPFPPSALAVQAAAEAAAHLELYSDPECAALTAELASLYSVAPDEVLFTNGSDDILNFAFMAFCDDETPAAFADITYGFYPVFAKCNRIPYTEIPLRADYTIDIRDYFHLGKTIFIANPNAPTGIALSVPEIEEILRQNPDNVVVIDEAYVDFGAESCVPLMHRYENLLVVQTFSKSRSMAGARLGFGIGCRSLIADLNTLKYSTNPYNINRMTMAAGIGALKDNAYTQNNCATICQTRKRVTEALRNLGFIVLDSQANFVFARHPAISGEKLYLECKTRGVLIRHFSKPSICEFNRITIGTDAQMDVLLQTIQTILEETT